MAAQTPLTRGLSDYRNTFASQIASISRPDVLALSES
jgi:hypothetical protein